MQDPWGNERAHEIGAELALEPAARVGQRIAEEGSEAARTAAVKLGAKGFRRGPAPGFLGEDGEDEGGVASHLLHGGAIGVAVAGRERIHGGNILLARLREDERAAIGKDDAGWQLGGDEADTRGLEVRLEQRIVRRHHEQRVGHGKEIVPEAGHRDLLGADAAAGNGVALEHADALALAGEHGGADQRVDAAADDDDVEGVHGFAAKSRSGAARSSPRCGSGAPLIRDRPQAHCFGRSRALQRTASRCAAPVGHVNTRHFLFTPNKRLSVVFS